MKAGPATDTPRTCFDCGRPGAPSGWVCEVCGGRLSTSGLCRPCAALPPAPSMLPDPWNVIVSWPEGYSASLSGGPGSGKSTLAATLCKWEPSGEVIWLTSEQTGEQVGAMFARLFPGADGIADYAPLVQVVSDPGPVFASIAEQRTGLIVIDSITSLAEWSAQIAILRAIDRWIVAAPGRRALVIQQINADGEGAGRKEIPHLVDTVGIVERVDGMRRLSFTKHRAGPIGQRYFRMGAKGIESPSFPYAYSVEGEPGEYRLHPYPFPGAKWAGLHAIMDESDDLQPGTASAAIPVPRYPNSVLEPGDVAERRAFAEGHGLRWLDPAQINVSAYIPED